ncbi:MAG: magnesium/cobalt transporter CorA [Methanobacteriota archaeon]
MSLERLEVKGKKDSYAWIDVEKPSKEELDELGEKYNLHHLALEDCLSELQRPKIEDYGEYSFIVAKHLSYNHKIRKSQIAFFVGKNFLITIHKEKLDFLAQIRKTKLSDEIYKISETPDYSLYLILDQVIDNYFNVVDTLSDEIAKIEQTAIKKPTRKVLEDILKTRRELIKFRRHVSPLREVLHGMQVGVMPGITKGMSFYFRDLYDHTVRVIELTETQRELISGVLETYLSSVSNSMNEVMKVLTVLASFILLPTLISGIYGMNFMYMPELGWRLGYPFALGTMFFSVLFLWVFFRKKQWI